MIICNRCGEPNPDDAQGCARCGHKLQSLPRAGEDGGGEGGPVRAPLGPMPGPDPAWRRVFLHCLEVCALGALLAVAVGYGLFTRVWWPVGAASVLAAILLWLRRGA